MSVIRKIISIYAFDLEPTVAITYNVSGDDTVSNVQFWVREDYKYKYVVLRKILEMLNLLNTIGADSLTEKDVFRTYQETFGIETLTSNYDLKTEHFNTVKISNTKKPYRNFVKTSKKIIHIFIENYIKKEN